MRVAAFMELDGLFDEEIYCSTWLLFCYRYVM